MFIDPGDHLCAIQYCQVSTCQDPSWRRRVTNARIATPNRAKTLDWPRLREGLSVAAEQRRDTQVQVERAPSIESEPFGSLHSTSVERYTLANAGMHVRVLTFGGILQSIEVPDRSGHLANVSLGFATLDQYVRANPFFGALIGRFANRIAKGRFTLDGVTYEVPVNDGPNSLHGGVDGFDKRVWQASPLRGSGAVGLKLALFSPHGDAGYPGALSVEVTYLLTAANALRIDYRATTDRPTVLNLTN